MRPVVIRSLLVSSVLSLGFGISFSQAAFTSSITPDGTLGTSVAKSGSTYNINGGTIKGTNQFHSLRQFSVGTGDTASFNGPVGILNILSRITGGQQSQIDGTITSTIQGANLYLMNPAGVLFGPNASLNLTGSFHVTTADYLRLTDGVRFNAVPAPQDALLTTAPVAAFGFLSNAPSPIAVQDSILTVPKTKSLSLIGGDITITGGDSGHLAAPGGQINIVSVASPGEALINAPATPANIDVSSFSKLGQIQLRDFAFLDTTGELGGTVVIRGGQLVMDSSTIDSSTTNTDATRIAMDIQIFGDASITHSTLVSGSFGTGRAGDIQLAADTLTLDGSTVSSTTFGDGNGGAIAVSTGTLNLTGNASIQTFTGGAGRGGNISVQSSDVQLTNSTLASQSFGTGRAGTIQLAAGALTLDRSTLSSTTFGDGNAGAIAVSTAILSMTGNASIQIFTDGAGRGGDISVHSNDAQLINGATIQTATGGVGQGGNIDVDARTLSFSNGAAIRTGTFGSANGGLVTLNVGDANISGNGSGIFSDAAGSGRAGDIRVNASNLNLTGAGQISAVNQGSGKGGEIQINASDVTISGSGSRIFTAATAGGDGSNIGLHVRNLSLQDGAGINSRSNVNGNAGNISIAASDNFVSKDSVVNTEALLGDGGNITIQVGRIVHLVGSDIRTTVGTGNGNGGNISIDPNFFIVNHSRLFQNAHGGNGGNVNLSANVFFIDSTSIIDPSNVFGILFKFIEVYAFVTPLPMVNLKISPLTSACAARAQGGSYSSFTVAGRDGVPVEPGGLLPSPVSPMEPRATTVRSGQEEHPESLPAPLLQLAFALPSCPE